MLTAIYCLGEVLYKINTLWILNVFVMTDDWHASHLTVFFFNFLHRLQKLNPIVSPLTHNQISFSFFSPVNIIYFTTTF